MHTETTNDEQKVRNHNRTTWRTRVRHVGTRSQARSVKNLVVAASS